MALLFDVANNLPAPILYTLSSRMSVPVHRVGDFYNDSPRDGCGRTCIWNGAGYYADMFTCGTTYPSGKTFYCSADCHNPVGSTERVFLSYRWDDSHTADHITESCVGAGIDVMRDLSRVEFLDSIANFMDVAADSRYFVALVTPRYFYSRYCMYEIARLIDSPLTIRAVPIVLASASSPKRERKYLTHWRRAFDALAAAVGAIQREYVSYLDEELRLTQDAPDYIARFLSGFRSSGLPEGEWWLKRNCRYLVGAISATFAPSEDDATNWTFSNKRVQGVKGSVVRASPWNPEPCYLHLQGELAHAVTRDQDWTSRYVRAWCGPRDNVSLSAGTHLIVLNTEFLQQLALCVRLVTLAEMPGVTIVPVFLGDELTKPTSELDIIRSWSIRAAGKVSENERRDIHSMLCRLGPVIQWLRDRRSLQLTLEDGLS